MTGGWTTLNGRWIGRYEYRALAGQVVAFEADLVDIRGALSGETLEPNTFRPEQGIDLTARITGSRDGRDVQFVKAYDGFDQGDDPVYEGQANAALTRIVGRWHFPWSPGDSGRFVMVRKPMARARVAAASETELKERD